MSKEIQSVCTYCGVGCDITAVLEDNKITRYMLKKMEWLVRVNSALKGD